MQYKHSPTAVLRGEPDCHLKYHLHDINNVNDSTYLDNKTYLCDVVVTDTLAIRVCTTPPKPYCEQPTRRRGRKKKKYVMTTKAMGATHLPFSVESIGWLSSSAQQLIREIYHSAR